MKTKLINLTPHSVDFLSEQGEVILAIPSSGVARCSVDTVLSIYNLNDIPVTESKFGEVVDLPDSIKGTIYIVSRLVVMALPDRDDLYYPNEVMRDTDGKPIGARSLSRT